MPQSLHNTDYALNVYAAEYVPVSLHYGTDQMRIPTLDNCCLAILGILERFRLERPKIRSYLINDIRSSSERLSKIHRLAEYVETPER